MGQLTKHEIEWGYRKVLGRDPESSAISHYLEKDLSLDDVLQILSNSDEYKQKVKHIIAPIEANNKKKVLLFGAYANGNIGDAMQAQSLADCLKKHLENVEIWATSEFDHSYQFEDAKLLPAGSIRCYGILKHFNALIIGGGGLLAHPHSPLGSEIWASGIPIPVALVSVGASPTFAPQASALICKAAFASGRDLASLKELSKFRKDVVFTPDPVLVDNIALPKHDTGVAQDQTCWVLQDPQNPDHERISQLVKEKDIVIGLEPDLDKDLIKQYPQLQLIRSREQFFEQLVSCRDVVSMRYHGLIAALRLGKPSLSYKLFKGADLFRMLGMSNCIVDSFEELETARQTQNKNVTFNNDFWKCCFDVGVRSMSLKLGL